MLSRALKKIDNILRKDAGVSSELVTLNRPHGSCSSNTRRPRILFLADRNILADQAYNSFSSFADDARIRIAPDSIGKSGKVPTNASIFFTIFQTFMSGTGPDGQPAPSCTQRLLDIR